ncbi:hypothetical protein ACWPKO_07730 [Coraliomargarita sp. W4R53]
MIYGVVCFISGVTSALLFLYFFANGFQDDNVLILDDLAEVRVQKDKVFDYIIVERYGVPIVTIGLNSNGFKTTVYSSQPNIGFFNFAESLGIEDQRYYRFFTQRQLADEEIVVDYYELPLGSGNLRITTDEMGHKTVFDSTGSIIETPNGKIPYVGWREDGYDEN